MKRTYRVSFKRAKTFEETTVETALIIGFLLALVLFVVLIVVTPLMSFLPTLPILGFYAGLIFTFFGLHALCTILWGIRERFSHRQFLLLAKVVLAFDVGIPLVFIGCFHVTVVVLSHPDVVNLSPSSRSWVARLVLFGMILFFLGTLVLLKKVLGKRAREWFRIKDIPDSVSINQAQSLSAQAERRLKRQNYEGAGEAFHFAATEYANLEQWSNAADNYLKAADALTMENDLAFGAVCTYGFAAAAFIIDNHMERATQSLTKGHAILERGTITGNAQKRASAVLNFLTAISRGDIEKAETLWKSLRRKVEGWMFPFAEEAYLLFEKALDTRKGL